MSNTVRRIFPFVWFFFVPFFDTVSVLKAQPGDLINILPQLSENVQLRVICYLLFVNRMLLNQYFCISSGDGV